MGEYGENALGPNRTKTKMRAFSLKNKQTKRKFKISSTALRRSKKS